MFFAWLLFVFPTLPNLDALGSEDWRTREREHQRCDSPLVAILLPLQHGDPEVNRRIVELRRKHLRWLWDAEFVERWIHHNDYERWLTVYVLGDKPSQFDEYDVFHEMHMSVEKASIFFTLAPTCEDAFCDNCYGIPIWLWGGIAEGEFEQYQRHRDSYRELYRSKPKP
jgi:hypothetical protein